MKRMGQKGFTLVEAMVAVSIAGIAIALGITNYQNWALRSNLRNDVADIKGALQMARARAMATGQPVTVQFGLPNLPPEVPPPLTPPPPGGIQWRVFIDNGVGLPPGVARNGAWDGCETIISEAGMQAGPCASLDRTSRRTLRNGITFQNPAQNLPNGFVGAGPQQAVMFVGSGMRSAPAGGGQAQINIQDINGLVGSIIITTTGEIL